MGSPQLFHSGLQNTWILDVKDGRSEFCPVRFRKHSHWGKKNSCHVVTSNWFWGSIWSDLVTEQTLMQSLKTSGGLTWGRGFTEDVRHLWTLSTGYTAAVQDATCALFEVSLRSRIKILKGELLECLATTMTVIDFISARLHSLATGVVSITGKETTRVRTEKSLDSHSFHEAKFKRAEKLITLDYLPRNLEVDKRLLIQSCCLIDRLLFEEKTSLRSISTLS